jgi:hypothetical protein
MKCPFCLLFLPDEPELHSPVGNDFFGEPARIGSMPSCEECAIIVNDLSERQRAAVIAAAVANTIAAFLADLATLFTQYVDAAREALLQEVGPDPDEVDAAEPTAIEAVVPEVSPAIYIALDLLGYRVILMDRGQLGPTWTTILNLCDRCAGTSAYTEKPYRYEVQGNHYCPKCFAELSARPLSAGA